ncbi:SDR family oxidoreductase [Ferrimonas sp. YFM]|uniref:SDR family oxidoreductase n=1 Tax=Ferrimonas sp. YFM TaxID=3028878 RepID=UPI0025728558|nr:SDR family oxidoreductase [Ferrimonas sp. YFM]BDY06586.1 NAD(P)-dependent oxidoreductase [Ferrimonas sp. YFM]
MIAITGANGQLGCLVIQSLLKRVPAGQLIALVRTPEKAEDLKEQGIEVRQADYNRPETLAPALAGADKLLLISGSEVGQRVPQHKAVIEAAREAGVKLLAYTSILKADRSPLALAGEHKVTEQMIAESGIAAVMLRNGWYTENYSAQAPGLVEMGAVAGAAAEGRLATAAREDYAEAAAVVLTSEENQAGKVYELAGSQAFTLAEFAEELARQSGKKVEFAPMSQSEFTGVLVGAGLPEGFAAALADAEAHAANGWLFDDGGDLERLLGRKSQSLAVAVERGLA